MTPHMAKKIKDISQWNGFRKEQIKIMHDAIDNTVYCSAKMQLRALNANVQDDIDYLLDLIGLVPEELA
jgi:hypothetical protein